MKRQFKALLFMWGSYIIAASICIVLSLNSKSVREESVAINIAFFAIVFLVYFYATIRFIKLYRIVKDINKATDTIDNDYKVDNGQLLWGLYRNKESLFANKELRRIYKNYLEENNRLNDNGNLGVYVDIEDYINYQVIDSYLKKNVLNLVSGTMTGLGILGTFVGLSFGLRSFNTGTTEEISRSIAPLMDGIKVAFHTSIYGMLLSLLFSFGYKGDLEIAYDAIDRFVDSFKNKVVPHPEAESARVLLTYQKKQTEEMSLLADRISEKMSEKMAELLIPQFDRMNNTIESFADVASKAQVEGIETIVNNFVAEMNKALGDSFSELSVVINETCEWQKQNVNYMQDILNRISDMTVNIREINEMSGKTIESMSSYISDIEGLQKLINENMMSVNLQIESYGDANEKQKNYIETLVNYEKTITEYTQTFSAEMVNQIESLKKMEESISNSTLTSIETLTRQAEESSRAISEAAQKQIQSIVNVSSSASNDLNEASQNLKGVVAQLNGQLNKSLTNTFDLFDRELSEITKHLSGTIAEVDATTGRVPKVVLEAYNGMEKSFEEMQENVDKLVQSLETIRTKTEEQITYIE